MIAIEITKMPEKCDGCKFEDRFGGCVLLNCIGNDYPVEEFDEEWRNARKEGRRLKYCPMKEVTRCFECKFSHISTKDMILKCRLKDDGHTDPYGYCDRGKEKEE